METFVDVFVSADGEKASVIFKKINEIGLKYHIGEHDFIYDWNHIVKISDELELADRIQSKLKGTGTILKFTTIR
jgi:hypothetical protein